MNKGEKEKLAGQLKRGHLSKLSIEDIIELINRADGVCYLCDELLNYKEIKKIEGDRKKPGGSLSVENLYLAHKPCNIQKGDQPLAIAKTKIRFRKFYEAKEGYLNFNDILNKYVKENRRITKIRISERGEINLRFNTQETTAKIFIDPATKIKYFFEEIPVNYLLNDEKVQPRPIDVSHLNKMIDDFQKHPIHEPSTCRLVFINGGGGKIEKEFIEAELLQFDGQHKSAAQILLGRNEILFKIYINPNIELIRDLVIIVQNEIKKKAVLESIVIKRMAQAYRDKWEKYIKLPGKHSEKGYIMDFLSTDRSLAKKEMINAIYNNIIEDEGLTLREFLSTGKTKGEKKRPISINLLKKVLKGFVYHKPNETSLEEMSQDLRAIEVKNVIKFLNYIYDAIFGELTHIQKKDMDSLPDKIVRIWKSGSVIFWTDILAGVINHQLNNVCQEERERPFQKKISSIQWEGIRKTIDKLFAHSAWIKKDYDLDKILNANDLRAAKKTFKDKGLDAGYLIT